MRVEIPDFNVLVALHQHDPDAFEDFRRHLLQESVNNAPIAHRPTLERLLSRIEAVRATAENPVDAARIAFDLMHDSVKGLNYHWEQALEAVTALQTTLLIERVRQ